MARALNAPADLAQAAHVELHALALHLHEHVDQRKLDLLEELGEPVLVQARALALGDHPSEHGALGHAVRARDASSSPASVASSSSG